MKKNRKCKWYAMVGQKYRWLLNLLLSTFYFLLFSCEQNLTLQLPEGEEKIVVEGHIEQDSPPLVVLTRSVPVFSAVSLEQVAESFVHGASVVVTVDGQDYPLQEFGTSALPPAVQELIGQQFGVVGEPGQPVVELFFYTNLQLLGQAGKRYDLRVQHEGRLLNSTTTIPQPVTIDSLWTRPHPKPERDSLVVLWYRYHDPDTLGNNVRYYTRRNREPFYPNLFSSVYNDDVINGQTIEFPLERGQPRTTDIDFDTYGYFTKGDTITIRWCSIDKAHFDFWNTLEADRNSTGNPAGSPIRVASNIKGGLGIWGGFGVKYYTFVAR